MAADIQRLTAGNCKLFVKSIVTVGFNYYIMQQIMAI